LEEGQGSAIVVEVFILRSGRVPHPPLIKCRMSVCVKILRSNQVMMLMNLRTGFTGKGPGGQSDRMTTDMEYRMGISVHNKGEKRVNVGGIMQGYLKPAELRPFYSANAVGSALNR
jgi:hypothetical protein